MKFNMKIVGTVALTIAPILGGCNSPSESPSPSKGASPAASQAVNFAPLERTLLSSARQVGACAFEQINSSALTGSTVVKPGTVNVLTGWSSNEQKMAPAQILFVLDGSEAFGATIPTGVARPDVASSYHSDKLANAGFSAAVSFSNVKAGDYDVKLLIRDGGDSQICLTNKHIVVSDQ